MAREPVYRAGISPGGAAAIGGADPSAFGAGVGRAIGQVADAIDRRDRAEKIKTRETEAAAAGMRMAEFGGAIDVASQEARATAAPGGEGHTEAIMQRFDTEAAAAVGAIVDPRVRQVYQQRYAEERARVLAREDGWQRGASIEHRVQQVDQTGSLLANGQAIDPTPEGLESGLVQIATQIGLMGFAADVEAGAVREQQRKLAVSWGNAMMERDHGALVAVLDSGALNPFLEPDDMDRLRDGAMAEGRRLDAAARSLEAEQAAQGREAIGLFISRIEAGDEPADAEFDQMQELALSIGAEGRAFDVQVRRQEVRINRETRTWTPIQFEQAINGLRAKGDARSSAENIQLTQLERIATSRVAEFVSDPQGAAARAGNPAPAVDWSNPTQEQIDRRSTWARGYAQANGLVNVPFMSPEEMRPYQERLDQGPAGLVEVARTLRTNWGAAIGGQLARQMKPTDTMLQLMVGLPVASQNWYARGAEARSRNPQLFDQAAAVELFDDYADAIPQGVRAQVFEAAANIASGIQDHAGASDFREETFETAINFAMGGTGRRGAITGGIGQWRDRPIWLPPELTQDAFDTRIARATGEQIVGAAVDERGAATGSAPRYMGSDGRPGRPLRPDEWRRLEFETVSPGVYRVMGPIGGALVDGQGRTWQFDVRRIR